MTHVPIRIALVLFLLPLTRVCTLGQDGASSPQTTRPNQSGSSATDAAFEGPEKVLFSPELRDWLAQPVDAFGFVFDEQRKPIPGVRIQAASPRQGFHSSFSMPYGGDDIAGKTAITDEQGRFRIKGIVRTWMSSEVMLRLRSPYRWTNDKNYELGKGILIIMSGSGKPGKLRLTLLDDETGKPLTRFMVVKRHIPKMKVTANALGFCDFPGEYTRHKTYRMYCYASGYEAQEIRAEALDPKSDKRIEVRMKPRQSLAVRLVDATTGKPISNARIMAAQLDNKDSRAWYVSWGDFDKYVDGYHGFDFVQRKRTGQEGLVDFSRVPEGELALIVFTDGYQRTIVRPAELQNSRVVRGALEVPLKPASGIMGRLTHNGVPVSGSHVSVSSNRKFAGLEQMGLGGTKTDDEGRYRLGSLRSGEYWLSIAGISHRISLAEGKVRKKDIDLSGPTVSGKTIPSATVVATPMFDAAYEKITGYSNERGEYRLLGLASGPHKIKAMSVSRIGVDERASVEVRIKAVKQMKVDVLEDPQRPR